MNKNKDKNIENKRNKTLKDLEMTLHDVWTAIELWKVKKQSRTEASEPSVSSMSSLISEIEPPQVSFPSKLAPIPEEPQEYDATTVNLWNISHLPSMIPQSSAHETSATLSPRYDLRPGEEHGYWAQTASLKEFPVEHCQAFLHALAMEEETMVLADTGANMSVIHADFAASLNLVITPLGGETNNGISGFGSGFAQPVGTATVKLTIGRGIVYIIAVTVVDFGEADFTIILGMDFLYQSATIIDCGKRKMAVPGGEWIPLVNQIVKYQRGLCDSIKINFSIDIPPGGSQIVRVLSPREELGSDPVYWAYRQRRWIATAVHDEEHPPSAYRITNISATSVTIRQHATIGAITNRNERPREDMVRINSNRYREWLAEVYEGSFSQRFLRLKQMARIAEPYVPSTTNMLSRTVNVPKEILRHPQCLKLTDERMNEPSQPYQPSQVSQPSNPSQTFKTSTIVDSKSTPSTIAYTSAPFRCNLPCPSIFHLDTIPVVDQTDLAPEVVMHEGADLTDELQGQLAVIPDLPVEGSSVTVDDLNFGEDCLSDKDRKMMRDVLVQFQRFFISSGNGLPPAARGAVCDIDVGNAQPIAGRSRRVRNEFLPKLFDLIKGLLAFGLITFSNSPWASPIVLVLKKGGKDIRLCIDYRAINSLQELLLYPMPTLDCMLSDFFAMQWFLSLDNASGFWVVQATKRARRISAFICPLGQFEWTRMAQGLKNAPMIYQRMITNALYGYVDTPEGVEIDDESGEPIDMFALGHVRLAEDMPPIANRTSFADDFTDGAETWEEIVQLVFLILQRLTYFNISISASKSAFGKFIVEFLGHIISRDGIRAKPRSLHAVLSMPFPETLRAMQSFLGSLNFYSRFIENYSIKASCLYVLSDEVLRTRQAPSPCIAAFEALKVLYASTPILRHANPALEFHVLLYVTDWAVSATLCQLYEGVLHPVRFCGRKLKGAETRYTRWEKEILALLRVLKVCYYELRNNRLVVYTRYDLLAWLLRDKQNRAERLPWAAILSPWSIRCIQVQLLDAAWNMSALLTHNLASPNDSTLDDLAQFRPHNMPNTTTDKLRTDTLPAFPPDYTGHVAAFDGAIKIKEKVGSYGAIIWRLPGWDVVWAHHGVVTDATVNTAEYGGLLCVLRQCIVLRLDDVHIFGDSRLVVHQFQGWNQCTKPHLQMLLAETKALTAQLVNPSIHHILRRWNGSADALATRGLQLRSNQDVTDSLSLDRITNVNLLPSLLQPTHEHVASLPPHSESTSPTVLGGHILVVRSGDEKCDDKAVSKASSEEVVVRSGDEKRNDKAISKASSEETRSMNSTNLPNLHGQDVVAMETMSTKIVNPPNLHDPDVVAITMPKKIVNPPTFMIKIWLQWQWKL